MSKQTGTIITVVVGVLMFLCCTIPLCIFSIVTFVGGLENVSPEYGAGSIPPALGIVPCCLSILVLVVPLLLWVFLVRGKESDTDVTI